MRRLILAIAMFALAFPFSFAQAQPVIELDQVTVEIWPEYDRPTPQVPLPSALVIYRIILKAETAMPAQVSLRIPKNAGQPYNLANLEGSQLYTLAFTTVNEGDWVRVNFTTPTPNVQLEYYDSGLAISGNTHSFDYKWAGDYKVGSMTFKVQQPPTASGMTITPNQSSTSQVEGGLTYFTNQVGPVEAGTSFTFKVSYAKSGTALTADDQLQPASAATTPPSSASTPGDNNTLILWGLGLGAVLLVGGLVWFFFQRQNEAQQNKNSYRRHSSSAPLSSSLAAGVVYCHQCGKRAQSDDTFCRSCGTKLRIE